MICLIVLEAAGVLVRIDKTVRPKMFHGATISQLGAEKNCGGSKMLFAWDACSGWRKTRLFLSRVKSQLARNMSMLIVRPARLPILETTEIFQGDKIIPQTVRSYQPVFSAAFIAHVEAAYDDEEKKNEICTVVPLPNHDTDWIKLSAAFMKNQYLWSQDKELRTWLLNNRLDGFSKMVREADMNDPEKQAIMQKLRDNAMPAMMKLQQFIAELN